MGKLIAIAVAFWVADLVILAGLLLHG